MLIDTHAHLADENLIKNIDNILDACEKNDIKKIISIGCTLNEAKKSISLAQQYSQIFATAGLYPHDNIEETNIPINERLKILEEFLKEEKIVAIGECGIDLKNVEYPEIKRELDAQVELFEAQLALAKKYNLPLIIHSRFATKETLEVLKNHKNVSKVWHCFTENYEIAKKALDLNCHISLTGIITYPKNIELRETVQKLPLEKIMLETDSPYLVPHQARNQKVKINNPSYVKMIAQEVSFIKNSDFNLVENTTSENAIKFFRIQR